MLNSLDDFDRAILRSVQMDNQKTHAMLGEEIGLSGSAVRRRLADLRASGIITSDVSLVDGSDLGVTLIIQLSFDTDTPEAYDEFDLAMRSLPNVKQSYHVSGSVDYVLIVQGESLPWY
ncbi:MAG: AsnC family transcriptional regulator, partial [Hyphomicrobiales bacterium]